MEDNLLQETDSLWSRVKDSYPYYPTVFHRQRFIINCLRMKLEPNPDSALIFDYGCGEGSLLQKLVVLGFGANNLAGCDVSQIAIEQANKKIPTAKFWQSKLPETTCKFDAIICCEVIEHTLEFDNILNWVFDHLKSNGLLVLTTQSGRINACDVFVGHKQHFILSKLTALLKNKGFKVEYSKLWGFPFFSLQKLLTNFNFESIKSNFLEGEMIQRKRIFFNIAKYLYYFHDLIPAGPQIYICVRKK